MIPALEEAIIHFSPLPEDSVGMGSVIGHSFCPMVNDGALRPGAHVPYHAVRYLVPLQRGTHKLTAQLVQYCQLGLFGHVRRRLIVSKAGHPPGEILAKTTVFMTSSILSVLSRS